MDISKQLRHDTQSEIVAVASFVVSLEVITTDADDAAIGQVAEGAGNRCGGDIINYYERQSCKQAGLRLAAEKETCATIDRNSARYQLIIMRLVAPSLESAFVGRITVKGERALRCQD